MLLAVISCLRAGLNLHTPKDTIRDWANITDFISCIIHSTMAPNVGEIRRWDYGGSMGGWDGR